jgi:hypothetical protein
VKHCFTYPEDGDITTQKTTTWIFITM